MKRVLVLGAVAAAIAVSAPFASATDPLGGQPPVVVDADGSDGSVGVGTWFGPRQPLLGAYVAEDRACVGFSYQIPVCVRSDG